MESELLEFRESGIHGTGAFARVPIAKGFRVIEYVGERISKAESLVRCEANNPFIFTLNETEDLDGNVEWNPARYINHSCTPNCDAELDGEQIWVVTRRDIQAGEEVTFNYGYDLTDYKDFPCKCGSAECVGFMVAEEFLDHVRQVRATT